MNWFMRLANTWLASLATLTLAGCPKSSAASDGGAQVVVGPTGPEGPPGPTGPAGPRGLTSESVFGESVLDYGADPTAVIDATAAFTAALTAAASSGGGTVWVPPGRFRFTGVLSIPAHVTLSGTVTGPFDPRSDPSLTTQAPTLLVENTVLTFVTLSNADASVANLLFFYPNQTPPSGTTPTAYPATVTSLVGSSGNKIQGCTFVNSFDAIVNGGGRAYLEHLNIGALHVGIAIDQVQDFVHIDRVTSSVFWDTALGLALGTPLDAWVAANSTGLVIERADSVMIEDFALFFRHTGIALLSSAAGTPYGRASDVDLDSVTFGVLAQATNPDVGFHFTNLDIGAVNAQSAGSAISLQPGGSSAPSVGWANGSFRGNWAEGVTNVQVGTLTCVNVLGAASMLACP